ncbi:MAG: hypothetical protein PHW22_03925 [Bacilli bacterium]|nr:hypothetical protein [Bacilli bacterium]
MEKEEFIEEKLLNVESQLEKVVDDMIYMYGRFLTIKDAKRFAPYKTHLVEQYQNLTVQRNALTEKLNSLEK